MKWLQKLKLVNWHYFKDEEIPFGKQTMITGKNSAGKSTIIDALQVLFIADGRMIRFNSSAHDDAKRSLISYLRGKIGSDDKQYLREGDFTTYLMAEFFDEAKKDYFVVGTVVDIYKDNTTVQEFFIVDRCKIQELDYINENGRLRNRDEFHRYIERLENRSILERTKEGYQKSLLHRMGQVDQRFFPSFSKALSFKPIQNVRDFVYDYILDEKELQLDIMKENFEVHQQYKRELEDLVVRQDALKEINGLYEQYIKYSETIEQQEYVIRQLKHRLHQEEYGEICAGLYRQTNDINMLKEENSRNESALQEARIARTDAYEKLHSNQDKKREKELREAISNAQKELQEQKAALTRLIRLLKSESEKIHKLKKMPDNALWKWDDCKQELLEEGIRELVDIIQILESERVPEIELSVLGNGLAKFHNQFIIAENEASKKISELKGQKGSLEKEIRDLENQKRQYPEPVEKLKKLLEQHFQNNSAVWIFCEEMEVQNEEWRNAIEGYLYTQRFDLLVEPEFFEEALQIYEKEKWNLKLEGVGLVNTYKERVYLGTLKENSLATEVQSENPVIQARIEHLMGRMVKAGSEKELSRHQAAITSSCMVYQKLVARQMKEERYRIPYIGSKAIPRQLELKRKQLKEVEKLLLEFTEYADLFKEWQELLKDARGLYKEMKEKFQLPKLISDTTANLENHQAELGQLDFEGIKRLNDNCEFWERRLSELESKQLKLNARIAVQGDRIKAMEGKLVQQNAQLVESKNHIKDLERSEFAYYADRSW